MTMLTSILDWTLAFVERATSWLDKQHPVVTIAIRLVFSLLTLPIVYLLKIPLFRGLVGIVGLAAIFVGLVATARAIVHTDFLSMLDGVVLLWGGGGLALFLATSTRHRLMSWVGRVLSPYGIVVFIFAILQGDTLGMITGVLLWMTGGFIDELYSKEEKTRKSGCTIKLRP